jgi:hypothetical protein
MRALRGLPRNGSTCHNISTKFSYAPHTLGRSGHILTSIRCNDRELVHTACLEIQLPCYTNFTATGANFEIPHFSKSVTQCVVDHGVDPTVRICSRHLEHKTRHVNGDFTVSSKITKLSDTGKSRYSDRGQWQMAHLQNRKEQR